MERTKATKTIDVRVEGDDLGTLHVEAYPARVAFDYIQTTLARMSALESFETGDEVGSSAVTVIDGNLVRLSPPAVE